MLAVVKEQKGPGYVIKEVPVPKPGPDQVLIKVKAVGICGSDIPIIKGVREVPIPLIPGHEFAGDIVEIGKNVNGFKVGDRVTPGLVIHCGNCLPCRAGLESLCDNILETGIHVNGAFAEYVVVPEKTVHHLPDNMSYEWGASIDPIASAYRPVKKAKIGSEDIIIVFGPGPIGIYALQVARAEGAKKLIVVGIPGDEGRLTMARDLGADNTIIYYSDTFVQDINQLTNGHMADAVIEATGNEKVYNTCLDVLRKAGRLSVAGVCHKISEFNFAKVVRHELRVEGSICYSWLDYQESLALVASGKVRVDPLITHRFPLKDFAKALEVIDKRESIKVILYPEK
ncbi:MAG TPA: alcohol dehydrogenase catalytic domain-containing protein [Clostridia bacterium]|nr:alcohol dehydrogenase catalytic domain-containing protein [Clostridia bacterium]